MKKIIFFIALIFLSTCSRDTSPDLSNPEVAIDNFLNACSSIDSVAIDSLSILEEYPLINSWTVRRISEPNIVYHGSIEKLSDSISCINDTLRSLQEYISNLNDSINVLRENYLAPLELLEKKYLDLYSKYFKEEKKFLKSRYTKASDMDRIVRMRKQVEIIEKKYLRKNEKIKALGIKEKANELEIKLEKLRNTWKMKNERKNALDKLFTSIQKSIGEIGDKELIVAEEVSVITDLKILSKIGIVLSKKANFIMLKANSRSKDSKWIIKSISYIGDN